MKVHREIVAEIERLRAREASLGEPPPGLADIEVVCETVGEEVGDRQSFVNLAAWALRGIALLDGEKP